MPANAFKTFAAKFSTFLPIMLSRTARNRISEMLAVIFPETLSIIFSEVLAVSILKKKATNVSS